MSPVAGSTIELENGTAQPLGARWTGRGTNFCVLSANATRVELCLFDSSGHHEVARLPLPGRTGSAWHGFLPARHGGPGLLYGYRVHGPYAPADGHRFNPAKLVVDPCAPALVGSLEWHPSLVGAVPGDDARPDPRDSAPYVPKGRVIDPEFDWRGVRSPNVPWRDTIIYELHVKGYTMRHPGVPPRLRGKYLGLAEPAVIDHLKRLGVTTVELMPCHAFASEQGLVARGLVNYWGYNPVAFIAPDARYAVSDPVVEFKTMVRALHEAGIEVILDVVFNHTAEGNEQGPTIGLRGLDNALYYRLYPHQRAHYKNFSGCGNTLKFDHPEVRAMAIECLRYWTTEMRVDGFRFDLAPVLGRDSGGYSSSAPFFAALRADPVLAYSKLIAEPWDVGPGGYQLGHFPAGWSEWNDRYRDTMRAFWRGDEGTAGGFAERFAGSSDLFRQHGRKPTASVNFVAAHDGFTLEDVVSYNHRHNEANLEGNADGHTHNLSWNCGVEGPSDDPAVRALRDRQAANLLATLFLSQGVPMLLAGDEFGHTQLGNNNAYCQDNDTTWLHWGLAERNAERLAFVRQLVDLRRSRLWLRRDTFLKGSRRGAHAKDVTWLNADGHELDDTDWQNAALRSIAVHMNGAQSAGSADDLLVLVNADAASVPFRLPAPPEGTHWMPVFDTARLSSGPQARTYAGGNVLDVEGRATVLLESRALASAPLRTADPSVIVASLPEHSSSMLDTLLDRLAQRCGIGDSYQNFRGEQTAISAATRRAILAAMGHPVDDAQRVAGAIESLERARWCTPLPPVAVVHPGHATVTVAVPLAALDGEIEWSIAFEGGGERAGRTRVDGVAEQERGQCDGVARSRRSLALPEDLPHGYHRLTVRLPDGETATCALVNAPRTCFEPRPLAEGRRLWGVAAQLYTLRSPGNWGIGDFADLEALVRGLAPLGASFVALNPLHALFPANPWHSSPYSPSSRHFLNVLYLSVERVPEYAECAAVHARVAAPDFQQELARLRSTTLVDYPGVASAKLPLLRQLFAHFQREHLARRTPHAQAFVSYRAERGESLRRHALHDAIFAHQRAIDEHRYWGWPTWPEELRDPAGEGARAFEAEHADEVAFHAWLQWQAERQLGDVQRLARELGMAIGLYGDYAVGVNPSGSETWSDQALYRRSAGVGAPPDALALKGQDWGIPPQDPNVLAAEGYEPFRELIAANMRHFGALRLDHIMALYRQWWVPVGLGATEGGYVRYPLDDLMSVLALESERRQCLVIGEDLGTVPPEMSVAMGERIVYSYRVLLFEKHADGRFRRPDEYQRRAIATVTTHDLPTLSGWWSGSDIDLRSRLALYPDEPTRDRVAAERIRDRDALLAALVDQGIGHDDPAGDAGDLARAVHVCLARSNSALVVLQVEDLLGMRDPVNVPGTSDEHANWQRKVSRDIVDLLEDGHVRRTLHEVRGARGD